MHWEQSLIACACCCFKDTTSHPWRQMKSETMCFIVISLSISNATVRMRVNFEMSLIFYPFTSLQRVSEFDWSNLLEINSAVCASLTTHEDRWLRYFIWKGGKGVTVLDRNKAHRVKGERKPGMLICLACSSRGEGDSKRRLLPEGERGRLREREGERT